MGRPWSAVEQNQRFFVSGLFSDNAVVRLVLQKWHITFFDFHDGKTSLTSENKNLSISHYTEY
jgi:hypothetical protein